MWDFVSQLFDTSGYPPRWYCGAWTPAWGWLHILSDLGVWSAYLAIPCVLGYFLFRRKDLPLRGIFWLFAAFILACGTTHLMEAIIFWWPAYRLAGVIKLATALVSWTTVVALVPATPRALAMRSPDELEREVQARRAAEDALRRANADLERRMEERTAELTRANAALREEVEERRRAEQRLREGEERLRGIVEAAPNGMVMVGPDGRVVLANSAMEKMFGYDAGELTGRSIENLVPERFRARHPADRAAFFAAPATRGMGMGRDLFGRRKDGGEFPVEIGLNPIRRDDGLFVLASVIDITERKKADEALRELNATLERRVAERTAAAEERAVALAASEAALRVSLEEKQVLLREIHHRVKNNLQVISSLLDMQSRYVRDLAAVEMFRDSQNRVRSMALVHERLYQSDALSDIDFAEYLRGLVAHLSQSYNIHNGAIRFDLDLEPVSLSIDAAVPCGLAVNELVSNCLKYAFPDDPAGVVAIRLTRAGDDVVLAVKDDGIGLSEHVTLNNPKTFGLRLVNALVDQLHGSARIDRQGGTNIQITFPAAPRKARRGERQ